MKRAKRRDPRKWKREPRYFIFSSTSPLIDLLGRFKEAEAEMRRATGIDIDALMFRNPWPDTMNALAESYHRAITHGLGVAAVKLYEGELVALDCTRRFIETGKW